MIFNVTKASDWGFVEEEVEINTLDELKQLQEKYAIPEDSSNWKNPSIIVDFNGMTIEIYDNYIE